VTPVPGVLQCGLVVHMSWGGGARSDPQKGHTPDRDARVLATRDIPECRRSSVTATGRPQCRRQRP